MSNKSTQSTQGISFIWVLGTALAVAISWSLYKSIAWGIIHGFFGWFYVLYYAITK